MKIMRQNKPFPTQGWFHDPTFIDATELGLKY